MATICDVAAHILKHNGPMTTMKLQKLCYYSYSYHLVWDERRLFDERFEAWANGPVSPVLYEQHRGRFNVSPGDITGDPCALDTEERASVLVVLENLGDYTAHQLSTMTHAEAPWVRARARAGVADLERSSEELDDGDIVEYFDALVTAAETAGETAE